MLLTIAHCFLRFSDRNVFIFRKTNSESFKKNHFVSKKQILLSSVLLRIYIGLLTDIHLNVPLLFILFKP